MIYLNAVVIAAMKSNNNTAESNGNATKINETGAKVSNQILFCLRLFVSQSGGLTILWQFYDNFVKGGDKNTSTSHDDGTSKHKLLNVAMLST